MRHAAVIVETRQVDNLTQIIEAHRKHTPNDWALIVFCSMGNLHLIPKEAKTIILPPTMNEYEYNKLLTSLWFWDQIKYDKVLIFQHDSEIFKPWDSTFEQWDYIGAPWKFQQHGGNGGLSWRSVEAMKWCINQTQWFPYMGNEDVYFSNILNISDQYKLAPREVCKTFSTESIPEIDTFGAHAIDKWLTHNQCQAIRGYQYCIAHIGND